MTHAANGPAPNPYYKAAEQLVTEAHVQVWCLNDGQPPSVSVRDSELVTPSVTDIGSFCLVARYCHRFAFHSTLSKLVVEREYFCIRAEEDACKRFGFDFPSERLGGNKKEVANLVVSAVNNGVPVDSIKTEIVSWCAEFLPVNWKQPKPCACTWCGRPVEPHIRATGSIECARCIISVETARVRLLRGSVSRFIRKSRTSKKQKKRNDKPR